MLAATVGENIQILKTRNNERNQRKLAEAVMFQTGVWEGGV
jgi:hypothetical protein